MLISTRFFSPGVNNEGVWWDRSERFLNRVTGDLSISKTFKNPAARDLLEYTKNNGYLIFFIFSSGDIIQTFYVI